MIPRSAALLGLLALQGCGVVALIHDKMLGPVSPAGNIHSVMVGDDFVVTERGVEGRSNREQPMFRPIPPGFPRRYGEPASLVKGLRGAEAFVRGLSFLVWGESQKGAPVSPEAVAGLSVGRTSAEVLDRLGPPNLWLRRQTGSIMAYQAELGTFLAFYLGMPPLADQLVPIPGLSSLTFRYRYNVIRPYKTILFFDGDERLVAWFRNDPAKPPQPPPAERPR